MGASSPRTVDRANALRILLVEDDPDDIELLVGQLEREGIAVDWRRVECEAGLSDALAEPPDAILLDYRVPTFPAPDALRYLQARGLEIPTIVVSGAAGEEVIVECLQQGADDFVSKDRLTRLGSALLSAIERHALRRAALQAETQLREREAWLQAFLAHVPAGVTVKDADGRYQYANAVATHSLRLDRPPLGRMLEDLGGLPSDLIERLRSSERRVFESGQAEVVEMSLPGELGDTTWLNHRFPLDMPDGERRIASIFVEITQQRRAERDLANTNQELRLAIDRAEQMAIKARSADRAKSDFLASMSHEIRTPMNGIIGLAELLLATGLSTQQRSYVEGLQRSSETLLHIINDILDLSKIEAGKLDLHPVETDIRPIIEDVCGLLDQDARRKRISLAYFVDRSVPRQLTLDPIRLRQILTNLIGNAVKFTNQGDVVVRVTADLDDESSTVLRVVVKDSGPGISPHEQPRLFEEYAQGGEARRHPGQGTGLGLAISGRLVRRMGGDIGVDSTLGRGSTFWFTLPCPTAKPASGPARPSISVEPTRPTSERGADALAAAASGTPLGSIYDRTVPHPRRILVVEDSPVNQMVAAGMLDVLGYTADVVGDGAEAVQAVATNEYAAILMDCQLPVMDGYETTAEIRRLQTSQRVPIVAMTAHAMQGARERCIDAGMDDFITKPVRMDDIGRVLDAWLTPARTARTQSGLVSVPVVTEPTGRVPRTTIDPTFIQSLRRLQRPDGADPVRALVAKFLEHTPVLIERMREAVLLGDVETISQSAHSLKGSAAIWGATDLSALCDRLERAGGGAVDDLQIIVGQIEASFESVRENIVDM